VSGNDLNSTLKSLQKKKRSKSELTMALMSKSQDIQLYMNVHRDN